MQNTNLPFLLLGGTGYLGRQFLKECIAHSKKIYLLIRNPLHEKQIVGYLEQAGLEGNKKLLQFFIGNAILPKFGLKQKEWEELSEVGKIFNLSGSTNFLLTRAELIPQNVDVVRNCIQLARLGIEKEIHHISTLSVLLLNDLDISEISENSKISKNTKIYGGYAQTKWMAEKLLQDSEVKHCIYRLGLLVGDTQKGLPNYKDSFTFFLKSAFLWKDLNLDPSLALDFLPVDIAAKEIFFWSEQQNSPSLLHIFGETLYFYEIRKLICDLNPFLTPNSFEIEYTKFLLELVQSPCHRIHPLGLFLRTGRNFTSKHYKFPKIEKEVSLQRILSNLL